MKKSSIEWTEFTSNPIRGKCLHACSYCYAERIRLRFKRPEEISWHPEELMMIEQRKKPSVIFMGSMYDIFGKWVSSEWINKIIDITRKCPQHTFLFLTKNPYRYMEFDFPNNCWLGYTEDGTNDIRGWIYLRDVENKNTFISFEPLIGNKLNVNFAHIKGVIIGAMTGPGAIEPDRITIDAIIGRAEDKPIFLKNNLLSIFPDLKKRQETAWKFTLEVENVFVERERNESDNFNRSNLAFNSHTV